MNLLELVEQKRQQFLKQSEESQNEEESWRQAVEKLYQQIIIWLQPLRNRGLVEVISDSKVTGFNLNQGEMRTENQLIVKFFNGKTIELVPVGLNIIGAYGRVDMQLGLRDIMIVLEEKHGDWQFAERYTRTGLETYPFNQENFEELIAEFVEGF